MTNDNYLQGKVRKEKAVSNMYNFLPRNVGMI